MGRGVLAHRDRDARAMRRKPEIHRRKPGECNGNGANRCVLVVALKPRHNRLHLPDRHEPIVAA
jgi:hypothetical protein